MTWLQGAPRATGRRGVVRSPWDDAEVGAVELAGPAEVEEALEAAYAARGAIAALPARARAAVLERAAAALSARAEAFAQQICREVGKPITLARAEVARATDTLFASAAAAQGAHGEVLDLSASAAGTGRLGLARRVPAGVVTAITPFNFPLNLALHKIGPAFAAGCPVILKPAPEAPGVALALAELLHDAGQPSGALAVLPMAADALADALPLLKDPRVAVVSFTGSAPAGRAVAAAAAGKRVVLELGGVAHNLVLDDADLDLAAASLGAGALAYAGQSCVSVQHVLVDRRVHDALVERLLAWIRTHAVVGDPADPQVLVGPVIRDRDADRVRAWIDEAIAAGAPVLLDGGRRGRLLGPTVLGPVSEGCHLDDDEVFGPVLTVRPFDTLDEAITRCNRSRWGLQAAIFTDRASALRAAWDRLEVGAIVQNQASSTRIDSMPYGGVKASGVGREGPRHALDAYTELRLWLC
jgi:acyl-CoA reductase-like NAD-dependent aldehyde dehydrogenase